MTVIQERSAGVIPYYWVRGPDAARRPQYLSLHSATVRNPRARWEFPKGGIEADETPRQTAAREFLEETSLTNWSFVEGFERSLSYTYIRKGCKVLKTVTYYVVEVHDPSELARSAEHVPDPTGHWYHWGDFDAISKLLYHAKIRQLFADADAFIRGDTSARHEAGTPVS